MQLLLARVGAGKTIALQDRLLELKQRKPLAKVWVLLSTERQIVDFRQRFMNGTGVSRPGSVSFNVEYFNFYSLYHHLLAIVGQPQRCLEDTARYGLIRAMLGDLYATKGGIFGGIAQTPGFIEIIAAFIYELKQNLIFPEDFEANAEPGKELELAQIYKEYQLALKKNDLVDREGEGWVALEALERKPKIVGEVDLLVVDGYDQFNALQANLLTVLGAQVRESLVALTTVPEREATIGRRFADALNRLTAAHQTRGLALDVIPFTARRDNRHPALKHLAEQLLRPKPEKVAVEDAVQWIEAPDPAHEVGALLRRVKRLLLEGCPPDEILIAVRDWSLYGGQIASQGQSYDLPLALHYGEALARNPAVVALLDLLSLHTGDFRRRDLLDGLRSPYFAVPGLDPARVDGLDRIGVEMQITGGRSAWLEALDLMARPPAPQRDDDDAKALPQLDAALVASLQTALANFFAGVTPPERGTVESYIGWLEKLIGADIADPDDETEAENFSDYSLNLPAQIRRDADAAIIARDLAAMQQLKRILRGLLSAQVLAESLDYQRVIDSKTFLRDLKTAVDNTTIGRGSARDGRVLVTTVTDARGLPQRHIFILGLSEGIFPQPAPEDPLLLDSERERLRGKGITLPTQAERAGDDGLFYSLIGQARDSLTLSRPHSKNGETWAASHLWRAAQAVFSDAHVEHLAPGAVPLDPATQHEAALVAVDSLVEGRSGAALLDWIDPDYWARIQRGREIELRRISREPHDRYSGRLSDGDLIAQVAQLLNPDRVWSASQLNDYGLCGFRYFAARLLKLEALEEPEDGMDARQLGTLYHEILEQTYARFARLGGAITPDRRDEALILLGQVADENMIDAPERLRFRASPQWAQEKEVLRRRLEKLIRDDFSEKNPLTKAFGAQPREVYRQEARFGDAENGTFSLDLGDEQLRVRGSIDRMDRQGDRVLVVDYKSGSTPIRKDQIERGRNFQMMVYLLAAQALIDGDASPDAPTEVAGGVFWKIGGETLGSVSVEDDAEVIEAGKDHIRRYLERARAGDFAAHANKLDGGKCASYCDFHQFCRVHSTHQRKR